MKAPRRSRRGFALLIVVLLAALLAVSSVALLDLVNLDLVLVGEQRKTYAARENAMGALQEIMGDQLISAETYDVGRTMLPRPGINSTTVYSSHQGAGFVKDPGGLVGPSADLSTLSAFASNPNTPLQEGFEANIRLLRMVPRQNSSLTQTMTLVWEIQVEASVNAGEASHESRALIFRDVAFQPGTGRHHGR